MFNEKFLLATTAIEARSKEAIISLSIIIVTGFISLSNIFVAINDDPQKITAKSISKYRKDFRLDKFVYFDFSVFFAEE